MKEENDIKAKVRKLFVQLAASSEGSALKEEEVIPNSITFTKTALPILYSNLILIEDMKYENSNYFLGANGFISKKITLSSLKHDPNFSLSNCAFRIFPRTYNVNKYKVLDFINEKGKVDAQDINFKFSAEIFNNLDIVQNKFGEPVRYGDIIMLMHDNTHMFIQYVNSTKSLTFSNHDGDATLFSVEPATEIMLNDNQILKAVQPIRLKVAGFNYASQNLYFGLSVPYSSSNKSKENEEKENENEIENVEEEEYIDEEQNEDNTDDLFSDENNTTDKLFYDKKIKKYKEKPDLVVEENSTMNWRFVLYNPFTTNEDHISFGDFIQIMYCDQGGVLGAKCEEKEPAKKELRDTRRFNTRPKKKERKDSFDLKENILIPDDEEIIIDDITDKDLYFNKEYKDTEFYLSNQTPYNKNSTEDVNSTWILENVYPYMKMQSFIRFYDEEKLDTYRMTFRIKHFKTNKILSIAEVSEDKIDPINNVGVIKGGGSNENKKYKFVLIDNNIENSIDEERMLSTDYQFSLFGFKKTNKSKSVDSTKPSINDFLKLYHVKTQCYVKIITVDGKKKNTLNFDDILKCHLTLLKYPDEKEVVKIERLHYNTEWKFKFIQNLYFLTCYIIQNLKQELKEMVNRDLYSKDTITNNENLQKIKEDYLDDFSGEENFDVSNFLKLKFVLDKLFKFVMNKFINKYNDYCGFNNVVNNRQLLISHFDFTNLFLVKIIYFYWLHDNNLGRIRKIEKILCDLKKGHELNNNNPKFLRDKSLYQMFRYTESIFQFMIIYCKDNSYIKKELYNYLYVFFNFINLSSACIDVLIEIFKNEESNLNFLIRDCVEKKQFKSTLELLFKEYFPEYYKSKYETQDMNLNLITTSINPSINSNNNQQTKVLTLFDLILEYIKISQYNFMPNYDTRQINSNREACKVNSFNSREKYIELLISLVHMNNKANIQDNQIYLIKKIIKIFAGNYILDPTLSGEENDYPPCLINLIYELAKDTKINDQNNVNAKTLQLLHEFITKSPNFKEEALRDINSDYYFSCNSKMYTYIKENFRNEDEDPDKVSIFFENQKRKFISIFKNKNSSWNINFLDIQQVELACSIIQFMKNMIKIDLLSPQNEKEFLNFLISFLRFKYTVFTSFEKISNVIQGDMIFKEKSILERITKTEHEKYISISETWHKIYQIFRRVLINSIEEKYQEKSREQKEQEKDNNYSHLKSIKPGVSLNVKKTLIENDEKLLKNISSRDKLVDSDEKDILKRKINKNTENIDNKLMDNETLLDERESDIEKSESSKEFKKGNTSAFDRINGENKNYENIIKEDLKKEKKILLIRNIVSVFRLLIRKNINCLKKNFIDYYLNNNNQFVFNEFVEKCIPCIEDGNENVNKLIRRYCEDKFENNFSSNGYINLNNFFESKTDDFNFIQNIIISFANSEEEETQEILIGLLYKYFHQRRILFRDIFQFNEYLLPGNKNGDGIKIIFNQFYQNYELNKNRYDSNKVEKVDFFFNSLIKDTLMVFGKIFNYWETFKENILYEKKKIEFMKEKIRNIGDSINGPFTQKIYLDNLSEVSYFLYYIRNNSESQYITSIISILNEHGEIYLKMYFSLINDIIEKGKALSAYFVTKSVKKYVFFSNKNISSTGLSFATNDERLSIKNKYFTSLILLILLGSVILPKDDKTLSYLLNLLDERVLKNDSFSRYLILLLISDIQKLSFSLDYFFIFNKCSEFISRECFGTLNISYDYNLQYPICFSTLFLDIIYNVLSFIIYKNKMISETYLDEYIADTFLLLLKKMNITKGFDFSNLNAINNDPESKDKIKLLIKLIKTINLMSNVEQLNKVIMLKIDPMNSSSFNNELLNLYFHQSKNVNLIDNIPIVNYYPQPHNLYQLFINNLHELYNDTGHKLTEERSLRYAQNIYELYKYILYYVTSIDTNYLANIDEQKKHIQNFILYVLYGYSCTTKKYETKSIDLSFLEDQTDEIRRLLDQITFSSFHLLFNQIAVVRYFDFCHKDINGIKIDQEEIKKNFKWIFEDFLSKTQIKNNEEQSMNNIENNFRLNTEINIKTTDNCSVNIYILTQIEEIILYSLIMNVSSNTKIKKGEKKNEIENDKELLEQINSRICYNSLTNDKDQKLFDAKQLGDTLEIIKQMIIQYENRDPKSKMVLFQKMLIEHKKDLHTYERKEATSIIYYILSFLIEQKSNQTEIIFTHFLQKSVDFINNTLNLSTELSSKRIKHITYLIFIIRKILSFYEKNEGDLIVYNFRKKTLREMQMIVEKTGLIKICLQFIKRYNNEKLLPFINAIFKMFCKMLKFGELNKEVATRGGSNGQKLFYNTFNIKNEFEQVFRFMT